MAARLSRGSQAFSEWFTRFYEFSKLEEAFEETGPVFSQLGKSSYIFLVTFPLPLARIFPAVSNALVRYCHRLTHAHLPEITASNYATSLALSNGPSESECTTALPSGQRYGPSVLARAQKRPAGDWDQRVKLYRHGANSDRWKPQYTTSTPNMWRPLMPSRSASYSSMSGRSGAETPGAVAPVLQPYPGDAGAHPADGKAAGVIPTTTAATTRRLRVRAFEKFKCPLDIIYGMKDIALDPRITLDGIEEYFVEEPESRRKGRVVRLEGCGHWALTEDEGVRQLEKTLKRIIEEE